MKRQQFSILTFALFACAGFPAFAQETPESAGDTTPPINPVGETAENSSTNEGDSDIHPTEQEPALEQDKKGAENETGLPSEEGAPTETQSAAASPPTEETQPERPSASLRLAGQADQEDEKPRYDGPAPLLDNDTDRIHIGGYGGISIQGTSLNGEAGLLLGGEGALLLGHRLAIGGAGYGLASEVRGPDYPNGDRSVLGFGYGGAVLRYHIMSKRSPVTASVGALVGAGGLTLVRKTSIDPNYEYDYDEDSEANAFFVAEPSAQVNLHLTRWMRLGVTGGYRFVRGPSLGEVSDGDLEGITAGGHVQFGWF